MHLKYSFIIPVFNRPEEIRELLQSMSALQYEEDFEVVIVEDGSTVPCKWILEEFEHLLNISYYYKANTGPGNSRNFGMKKANGNYFIILDSDVILPQEYLNEVNTFLSAQYFDCFGGPDAAHENFSTVQKAINYSMTSVFTTGGIRGGKKAVDTFQPRSFNMGISKEAFEVSGGFGFIHPGEDPDLSLRLQKLQFSTTLIPNAFVYHKRRIDWGKFYHQVHKFGMVRPILNQWHPQSAKITYWFPSLFTLGLIIAVVFLLLGFEFFFYCYLAYFAIIWIDATVKNKSYNIGNAAVVATVIQFYGYGYGFLKSIWKLDFLKMDAQTAFPKLFFNDAKKSNPRKPFIKRGPLKTFMFFLASAAVIWVFVQFSKQYTETVSLPVEYINIPQDKILAGNYPNTLEMRLRDNGFRIARYNLFPPTLEIDVTDAVEQNNALFFDLEQQKPALLSQLGVEFEDAYFLQPSLSLDFEQKAIKTVKVVSNIVPEFAVGYSALEEIELNPDSVRISGPASVLDTLEEIGTAALRINNISNDISGKVKIETGNLKKVVLFNDEVEYTLRTAKFTEGKVEIPIDLVNVPENTNVVIFPKEVMVFYQVSLEDFDKIKPSSFRVVVDFNKSAITDGYLLAELAQKPEIVNNVRLSEKKIQFVIKR